MTVLIPTLLYDTVNFRKRARDPYQFGQNSQHKKHAIFHSFAAAQLSSLFLRYVVPRHWVIPTFRANAVVSFSKKVENVQLFKIRPLRCLKTSDATHAMTRRPTSANRHQKDKVYNRRLKTDVKRARLRKWKYA
jgi:hypothetical protein